MGCNGIQFSRDSVDVLFPMHLTIDPDGRIATHGPTLTQIFGERIVGQVFFECFNIEKPRRINDHDALRQRTGVKLVLTARPDAGEPIQFRAVATALHNGPAMLFLDLSLGHSLADAIKRFDLTGAHFRANDFSIDLFYTFETQRTLLDDSQKMAQALTAAKEDAERKAYIDPVTNIANRRALYQHLEGILQAPVLGTTYALMHIDLDKFKLLNDTFGHAAGDQILVHTAQAMLARTGPNDIAARIGGDEFVLVLRTAGDNDTICHLANELITDISRPIRIDNHSCNVGASIGIVLFQSGDRLSADRLLINSDIALYEAKGKAENVRVLSGEMISEHSARVSLIADIEDGLARNQFIPFFQPQIDTDDHSIYGLEVLARWRQPSQGIMSPDSFLETAIRANLMAQIDQSVRQQAIRCFAGWLGDGVAPGKLSLNVSASNLRSPDFLEQMHDELFLTGLVPGNIQIELLESILFDQTDRLLIDQCHALKRAGFTLALDDFGTGHASISTLIDTPISTLKIDRSFVHDIDQNPRMQNIAGSILAMAKHIGLEVMAEGVESLSELEILQAHGCRLFQGYYFSAPKAPEKIYDWIESWRAAPPEQRKRPHRSGS